MLAKSTLLCYNNYSDKKRVIICVLKGILDVCFSVKSTQWKTAQPCGFEPFFFCSLSLAHGPFCRILTPETGADFPSGGIRLKRFRLLHHQYTIKILAPAAFRPELSFSSAVQICPPERSLIWPFLLIFQILR